MRLGVNLQGGVDAVAEVLALRLEPFEHLGVNVQRDGHQFPGIRRRASAKKVSSKGGMSDVSISSSVISLTLAQFVSEGFFKPCPLML